MRNKLAFCLLAVVLSTLTVQVQAISTEALKQGIPSLAPMLEQVTPAVVSIRVTKSMPESQNYYFNNQRLPEELQRFFDVPPDNGPDFNSDQPRRPYATGAGSGIIIDASRGYIVTNHHVVDGADSIVVQTSDNRTFDARLLGSDASTDVALLEIDADKLVDIPLADISTVQVGDYVVAIGNPFGIGQTVTSGIVSALGRAGLNNDNYEDFIQTDAAINLGNSGGALVDMEGRLIGMNTAIISGSGGSNGIGFAVPGDMLSAVLAHLERDGEVRRGMLGVTIADVTPEVTSALDVGVDSGAIVTSILPDSAAERAGLEISDVIVAVDDHKIAASRELRNTVGLLTRGQEVKLTLYRGGKRLQLDARIGGPEGQATLAAQDTGSSTDFRGAQLGALNASSNAAVDAGLEVIAISQQSPAWAAGLREGDIVVEVNRQSVASPDDFEDALQAAGRLTALTVVRGSQRLLLFVS
jgi:Do/DeqQ family serine protease